MNCGASFIHKHYLKNTCSEKCRLANRAKIQLARHRRLMADNPIYRERIRVLQANKYQENKHRLSLERRDRLTNDPEFRERIKRQRQKTHIKRRNGPRWEEIKRLRRAAARHRAADPNYKEMLRIKQLNNRINNPLVYLFSKARRRAIKRGLSFTLTKENFPPADCCQKCKQKLVYGGGRGVGPERNSASLDRILNDRGYDPPNCQWLCFDCNRRKSDLTKEDLQHLLRTIEVCERNYEIRI